MELQLCRVSGGLSRHERRKGMHPRLPVQDGDILRSLAYWRQVRRSGAHALSQYSTHRREAMRAVELPVDRKPAPVLHPVFAGMFRSMGLAA